MAQVETRAVTLESEDATLSGMLFLSEEYGGRKLPVVVVTVVWTIRGAATAVGQIIQAAGPEGAECNKATVRAFLKA